MIKNKKAWVRIFEAFVAVVLIFGFALFSIYNKSSDDSEEIMKLQENVINSIISDNKLRNELLAENVSGTENKIRLMVPGWISYRARVCDVSEVCYAQIPPEILASKEIYSSEALILSNLTTFSDKKLKLFFWKI
jgi:hypothetical protein